MFNRIVKLGSLLWKTRFQKIKVALNPVYRVFLTLPKVMSYPARQNMIIKKPTELVYELLTVRSKVHELKLMVV